MHTATPCPTCSSLAPWHTLAPLGRQGELELANCPCGTTRSRPLPVLPAVAALLSEPLTRGGALVRVALWCRLDETAVELDRLNAGWSPLGRRDRATERRVAQLAAERVRLWEALGLCPEHGDDGCDCDEPADDESYAEHMAARAEERAFEAEGEVGW